MYDQRDPYEGPPPEQADSAYRMDRGAKLDTPKTFKKWPVIIAFIAMCLLAGAFFIWRQNAGTIGFNWFKQEQAQVPSITPDRSMLGLDQSAAAPDTGVRYDNPAPPDGGAPASDLPAPTTTGGEEHVDTAQEDKRVGWQKRRPDFSFKKDKNWAMWQYRAKDKGAGAVASGGTRTSPDFQSVDNEDYQDADEGGEQVSGRGDRRSQGGSAQAFYSGGNQRGGDNDGLDHKYGFRPELKGCVLKAGQEIRVQSQDTLEATLPGEVTLYTIDPTWGKRFLRNGRVERCLWAQPASSMLLKANVQNIERGQVRVQVCASRLDKRGGGRINLGCMNGYDRDGSSGLRAISDRDWSGAITGLMFEAALSTFDALGNSIGGGRNSPVTVALGSITQGTNEIGREFVYEELRKPAKLTVYGGNVFYIKANADISDIPQPR